MHDDDPQPRPRYSPAKQRKLERLSPLSRETSAALVGPDPITIDLATQRFAVSRWAIYKRRRRAEMALGRELPRYNRRGRPRKPIRELKEYQQRYAA